MVKRINFLEKGAYTLTYRNMLVFAGAVCLICVLFHGLFMARHVMIKSKVGRMNMQVQELTVFKEKTLAAMQIASTQQASSAAPLAALFVRMPVWSALLNDMSGKMPRQVWLEQIRSVNAGDRTDMRKFEIAGKSMSHASIAQFVGLIDDSKWFSNAVLVSSKKEQAGGYSFLINADVIFPEAQW